jgi:hypothetical protein
VWCCQKGFGACVWAAQVKENQKELMRTNYKNVPMLELLWQWHVTLPTLVSHRNVVTDELIEPNNSCNLKLCGWVCDSGASCTFSFEICDVWTTNVTGEYSNHLLLLGFMSCWTCAKISGAPVSSSAVPPNRIMCLLVYVFRVTCLQISHQLFVHFLGGEWYRMLQHLQGAGLNMTSLVWHIGPAETKWELPYAVYRFNVHPFLGNWDVCL